MSILICPILKVIARQLIPFLMTGLMTGVTGSFSYGQSINELRNLWQDNKFGYISDNQKDRLFSIADFHKYSRIRDDEFAEYLKEPWHDYSIFAGLSDEPRNSLIKKPVFNYSDLNMTHPVNLPYSAVVGFNDMGEGEVKSIPRIRKPESDVYTVVRGVFLFYGQQISINYDKLLVLAETSSVSEDSVSGFWKSFSRSNSNHLVDQLMDYRDLLGLGDWGYFQLVKAASSQIFPGNRWSTDLLTWALMIRSGFDVRLAYNQSSTTVLFPSENIIYSRQFVMIGMKRFYLDRGINSQLLVTCMNPFPDTGGMIDLRFYKSMNFNGKLAFRKFLYPWGNKNYEFTLRYNPELIRFYSDYPQTDPAIYFSAPLSSILKEDLLGQFYPLLSKMNQPEAIVFLQRFVQREFDYSQANQKDKFTKGCFSEEIVASKSGDDRGKAVLFSWFIRVLLRLPVVGVHFPGYYSAAVCFDESLDGDFYFWNRRKYYFADPTFQNASIGAMIPEFSGLTPQLIDLSESFSQSKNALEIWKLALKMGARRGGTGQDVVFDRQGRALITGYFSDSLSCFPFIACFSQGKSLKWIRKFEGDGKAVAFTITKINDDEIYIAGSFKGQIVMDGIAIQSENRNGDLFMAQLNQNGELIWLKKAGIDSSAHEESSAYLVKFDRSGDKISILWTNEDVRNIKNGFCNFGKTELCFTGSKFFTTGLVPFSWTAAQSDITGGIYKEYTILKSNRCHPKVAGVVALMNLLQKSGSEVTGNQLQMLLTRYKPSFPVDHASLFKMIGQIRLIKNENGIISLLTIDNKALIFNNIIIENGAGFNIAAYDNGDLSVGVISGTQWVVSRMALSLNSLLIDYSSGNLILDYDHTMKTVSIETLFSAR